ALASAARRATNVRPMSASCRSENVVFAKSDASHSSQVYSTSVLHSGGHCADLDSTSSKQRRTRPPSSATAHAMTPRLLRRRSSVGIEAPVQGLTIQANRRAAIGARPVEDTCRVRVERRVRHGATLQLRECIPPSKRQTPSRAPSLARLQSWEHLTLKR